MFDRITRLNARRALAERVLLALLEQQPVPHSEMFESGEEFEEDATVHADNVAAQSVTIADALISRLAEREQEDAALEQLQAALSRPFGGPVDIVILGGVTGEEDDGDEDLEGCGDPDCNDCYNPDGTN